MKRTRAVALALVNWKGVFYERYQLDANVTALEGANGSGKTTVLIAAYIVLLPDMTRLRFTNVGEHAGGSGDRGLWGRLGRPGRPSYSVLDLRLPDGARLLAGVHLERRSEPVVEPTPFVVTDLPDHVALQDVLLERGDVDGIPELAHVKEQVARLGARLHQCASAKEYFAMLFERGVTPMKLATDTERTKLNDMLRTSMTGGISRALTNELRGFLLKEETGLADALKRMRGSLEACRRTRIEVDESRRLEAEISAVYEAGQSMFAAAVHATSERAQELLARVDEARRALETAEEHRLAAHDRYDAAKRRLEAVRDELQQLTARLASDREQLSNLQTALRVSNRLRRRASELKAAAVTLDRETQAIAAADEQRRRARDDLGKANAARERAAEGLADFQKGLDELNRRASEHRLASEQLAEAERLLGVAVESGHVAGARENLERELRATERAVVEAEQTISTAQLKRSEHEAVMVALSALAGRHVSDGDAFEHALGVLRELREQHALAQTRGSLPAQIQEARALAARQQRARALAAELRTAALTLDSQASVADAVEANEAELISGEELRRTLEDRAHEAARSTIGARAALEALNARLSRWRETSEHALRLERDWNAPLRSEDQLRQFRAMLVAAADTHKARIVALDGKRRAASERASALETGGGEFPASLLDARDAVGGELLAARYEDLEVDAAPAVQALLGPLSNAIIVEDPAAAARVLASLDERPDTVFLVEGDAALELGAEDRPPGELIDRDAVVATTGGLRITRLPAHATLGRRAREQTVAELRAAEGQIIEELEAEAAALQRNSTAFDQSELLLRELDILAGGDPSDEIATQSQLIEQQTALESEQRDLARQQKDRVAVLRERGKRLRDLAGDAWLLDAHDHEARVRDLEAALDKAKQAARVLEASSAHQETLEAKLDILRVPPPTHAQVEAATASLQQLRATQEWQIKARLALRDVEEHHAALAWSDAATALHDRTALLPTLTQQLEGARTFVTDASAAVEAAETAYAEQSKVLNGADAAVRSLDKAIEQDRTELASLGLTDVTDVEVTGLETVIAANEQRRAELEKDAGERHEELIRLDERLKTATQHVANRTSELADQERMWRPEQDRWEHLQAVAEEHHVLAATLTHRFVSLFAGQGSANLRSTARQHVATLKERLSKARESDETLGTVQALLGSQELSAEVYLQAWLSVRDWLRRRIPAQLADTNDPIEALARLRDHLAALQLRLARQESALRGESEDVARNIDIHIRRAQRQVSRLNDDLQSVRFGSIRGVRLRLERVERMEQVLDALRSGEGRGLFETHIPIEDALDELFRRYGGGKLGGQRLLDYREYIDPRVEVKRQEGVDWELVNPNRLSTGEGIGIGAALMMVVLTSWERDANLLRPKRSHGTLRLLFLDEANRLDRENLGVLFDLCESLQLQLLLAAPEVARAEGNTTYRLVRRVGGDGLEEVIVTGRRVASAARS